MKLFFIIPINVVEWGWSMRDELDSRDNLEITIVQDAEENGTNVGRNNSLVTSF
jgi:hypothetical protein